MPLGGPGPSSAAAAPAEPTRATGSLPGPVANATTESLVPPRGRMVRLAAATVLVLGVTLGIGLLVRREARPPARNRPGERVSSGAAPAAPFAVPPAASSGSGDGAGAEAQGSAGSPAAPGGGLGRATSTRSSVSRGAHGEGIVHLNADPWAMVYEGSTSLGETPSCTPRLPDRTPSFSSAAE